MVTRKNIMFDETFSLVIIIFLGQPKKFFSLTLGVFEVANIFETLKNILLSNIMLDITIFAYTKKTYPTTQTTKNEEIKSFEKSTFSTKLGVMVSVNSEGT